MPTAKRAKEGLYVKHLTAGKELYEAGKLEDAEKQLEEAYLLRPREQKVLNLLGLLYFKLEKYEKAEEVYRKLAAESPEAHTLYYNMGLIYLKLSRFEDAEMAFLKSLELSRENPKINFYLGSIYERQRRFQDAIFQYRQAGANVMVRRVEDRMQPGAKPPAPRQGDTAEFHEPPKIETAPFLVPPKPVVPVSDVLLSDAAPRPAPAAASADNLVGTETRPPTPGGKTLPPTSATLPPTRSPDIVAFLASLPIHPTKEKTGVTGISSGGFATMRSATPQPTPLPTPSPRPVEAFRILQTNLMEITFSGKVFVKQGTIYSYTGNLTFWVKDKRPGGMPALVIVTGSGRVLLTERDREIRLNQIDNGVHVQPHALLACEDTLSPRYVKIDDSLPEILALEGRGQIALAVGSRALSLTVTPDQPVAVAASSIVMWTGSLKAHVVHDQQISEALLAPGAPAPILIRLEGAGRVLMEQAL